jgi:hypothetical protein
MRLFSLALVTLLFSFCCVLSADEPRREAPKKPTSAEAKAAAEKWLADHKEKGLILNIKEDKTGFVGRPITGSQSTMFVYQRPGWYINLGFAGKVTPKMTVEQVRKQFKYVALDRLPLPGLDVPGWEVRPRTPVSSFKEGVEIVDYKDGRIQLKVKSRFFAIYGRDPSVLVPADAPSPPSAYFQVRRDFPLDLTIDAPFAMGR